MINHFDMAKEMARLVDAGTSDDEVVAEMRRMFPMATAADYDRAKRVGIERFDMLQEERMAAARSLADTWFSGASKSTIDAATKQYLKDVDAKFKPGADTLFPKPDKSKS
jgi:hypothetical protein